MITITGKTKNCFCKVMLCIIYFLLQLISNVPKIDPIVFSWRVMGKESVSAAFVL